MMTYMTPIKVHVTQQDDVDDAQRSAADVQVSRHQVAHGGRVRPHQGRGSVLWLLTDRGLRFSRLQFSSLLLSCCYSI